MATRPPYLVLPPPSDLDRVARDLTRRGWQVHRGFTPADEPWDLAPARVVAVGVVADRDAAEAALLCAVRGAGLVVTLDQARSWAPGFLHDLARLEPARAIPTGAGAGTGPAAGTGAAAETGATAGVAAAPGAEPAAAGAGTGPPDGAGPEAAADRPPPGTARPGGAPGGSAAAALTAEQCDLLDLLAAGHSIAEAARTRYLSLRTANRRVADARTALGVPTTREAVLAYVRLRGRSGV
jgi:DNA-binding CsgD family transcriptional regulator